MTYRNPNRSGYRFIGSRGDKLPVDPLVVGSAKVFEKISLAVSNSEFKTFTKVIVVRGYTNVYIYKQDKFDKVLEFLKGLVK